MIIHTPEIERVAQKGMVILKPRGAWIARTANEAEPLCDNILQMSLPKQVIFDLSLLKEFDTTGVWLLERTIQVLQQKGYDVENRNQCESFLTLSSRVNLLKPSFEKAPEAPSFFIERLISFGKACFEVAHITRDLIIFLGQVSVGLFFSLRHPKRIRFVSIIAHMERFGVNAIPIIAIMSIALGMVLAYQGEEQLRRFGAEIYTINLVSIGMLREVAILITAILVAGRTGSSITAQIGIMKINQEIDALNTLGLSPMDVLIIPRVLALIFIMPLLAFVSDIAGLLGGGIMVILSLDVSPQLYITRVGEAVTMGGFWVGILKAPFFGAIVGVVSCFEGMHVKGTAESVGIYTTRSVVEGIFLVTLADALLSIFFTRIGI